jgi:hypothetical protein
MGLLTCLVCFFYEELINWLHVLELTAYVSSSLYVITPSEHNCCNVDSIMMVHRATALCIYVEV